MLCCIIISVFAYANIQNQILESDYIFDKASTGYKTGNNTLELSSQQAMINIAGTDDDGTKSTDPTKAWVVYKPTVGNTPGAAYYLNKQDIEKAFTQTKVGGGCT